MHSKHIPLIMEIIDNIGSQDERKRKYTDRQIIKILVLLNIFGISYRSAGIFLRNHEEWWTHEIFNSVHKRSVVSVKPSVWFDSIHSCASIGYGSDLFLCHIDKSLPCISLYRELRNTLECFYNVIVKKSYFSASNVPWFIRS